MDKMDAWDVIDRTDDMNVIDSTSFLKLKRFPYVLIYKFKDNYCSLGYQQLEGF